MRAFQPRDSQLALHFGAVCLFRMSGDAAFWIAIGFFVFVTAFFIWLGRRQLLRMRANLAALAARQGLTVKGKVGAFTSHPEVSGQRHGRALRFWGFATGSGKSRTHWVAVGICPRRCGRMQFSLEPQGAFSRLRELFGQKEIQLQDPAFDAAWFVRTNEPESLAAALLPEIRSKLMEAQAKGMKGTFQLKDYWVSYVQVGYFSDEKLLTRMEDSLPLLDELADIAEVCAPEEAEDGAADESGVKPGLQ